MVEIICKQCKKKFEVQNHRKNTAKFCSYKCRSQYQKKFKKGKNSPKWKKESHIKLICAQCGEEYDELIQRKERSHFCSKKCKYKWESENRIKEKRYNWKGGNKRRNEGYYNSKYKKWRSAVFERDNWTCQTCRSRGVYLEAHHIKSWAEYPELRFDIDNGVALCKDCHNLTKKGRKKVG